MCIKKKVICWIRAPGPCYEWVRIGEEVVQFADFQVGSLAPVLVAERKKFGIGEVFIVHSDPFIFGPDVQWSVDGAAPRTDGLTYPITANAIGITAPSSEGEVTVTATKNGCSRTMTFEIVEPSKINYIGCAASVHHVGGQRDIGFWLELDFDEDDVSFYNVEARELGGPAEGITGVFLTFVPLPEHDANDPGNGLPNPPGLDGAWFSFGNDNVASLAHDHAAFGVSNGTGNETGAYYFDIPIEYRVKGTSVIHELDDKIRQAFELTDTCAILSKGDMTESGCETDNNTAPNIGPNCP